MFRLSLTCPLVLLGFPLGDVGPAKMTLCPDIDVITGVEGEGEDDDHRAAHPCRSVEPIFLFEFSGQIFLCEILEIFIRQRIEFVLQATG
jgi:hypothetical protein